MGAMVNGTGVIVIVDDDRNIGFLIQRILRDIAPSYEIVFAQHGAGAIVQIDSRFVPLVITDYSMPDMNGVEVTQAVKLRSPQTKVLALTGMTSRAIQDAFRAAGADFFLPKPVALAELRDVLRRAFSPQAAQ